MSEDTTSTIIRDIMGLIAAPFIAVLTYAAVVFGILWGISMFTSCTGQTVISLIGL